MRRDMWLTWLFPILLNPVSVRYECYPFEMYPNRRTHLEVNSTCSALLMECLDSHSGEGTTSMSLSFLPPVPVGSILNGKKLILRS